MLEGLRRVWFTSLCALVAAAAGSAQTDVKATSLEVTIVGASVSAGFKDGPVTGGSATNDTVPLQRLIKAWLSDEEATVRSRADLRMFQAPVQLGRTQIDRAKRDAPDLVLAVDFLFWFGYGFMFGDDEQTMRLDRLEQGLSMLVELECPTLVGNLPDMTGAARRMLAPEQIPTAPVLQALNARIAAWASERPSVRLFDLSTIVRELQQRGTELVVGDSVVTAPPGSLLQGDRLHANRLGMAYLGHLLQSEVATIVAHDHALARPRWTLAEFVAAAGAEHELQALRDTTDREPVGAGRQPPEQGLR